MSKPEATTEVKKPTIFSSIRQAKFDDPKFPVSVMDEETCRLLDIEKLHEVTDYTSTRVGSLTLARLLRNPMTSVAEIKAKQEALLEIRSDNRLRRRLNSYVGTLSCFEEDFFNLLSGNFDVALLVEKEYDTSMYDSYKGTRNFLKSLVSPIKDIDPKSDYLQKILADLDPSRNAAIVDFGTADVYTSVQGLRIGNEASRWEPKLKFKPSDANLPRYLPIIAAGGYVGFVEPGFIQIAFLGGAVYLGQTRTFEYKRFVNPYRRKVANSPELGAAIENLGKIDELLSFVEYADSLPGPVTMPEVFESQTHYFEAEDLKSPIRVKEIPNYVGNDVTLDGDNLTFYTGPVSGGKSLMTRSILTSQVLLQNGSFLPARRARASVADKVLYSAPSMNGLDDLEGRFGVEMARNGEIFYSITPKSLVGLDEFGEATTHNEKLKLSIDFLDCMSQIGNNTILVTHSFEIAQHYQSLGKGQHFMAEFDGEKPTFKMVPGISTNSHSERVLKQHKLTREDMEKYISEKGYGTGVTSL